MSDDHVTVDRHWCLTEDRSRVVHETDPAARWLYWRLGDRVPRAEAQRLGAIPPGEPEVKMQERAGDKALGKPGDKAAGKPDAKAVREWAAAAGLDVSDRGRIPDDVMDVYLQAHREA